MVRPVVNMALGLGAKMFKGFRYSFGEGNPTGPNPGDAESAHVTFPLLQGMDRMGES
jgi:hypothetical protein